MNTGHVNMTAIQLHQQSTNFRFELPNQGTNPLASKALQITQTKQALVCFINLEQGLKTQQYFMVLQGNKADSPSPGASNAPAIQKNSAPHVVLHSLGQVETPHFDRFLQQASQQLQGG